MTEIPGENSRVTFTVKELFSQINEGIKDLRLRLDLKADHKDLERLTDKVDSIGKRLDRVETIDSERDKGSSFRLARKEYVILVIVYLSGPFITALLTGTLHT